MGWHVSPVLVLLLAVLLCCGAVRECEWEKVPGERYRLAWSMARDGFQCKHECAKDTSCVAVGWKGAECLIGRLTGRPTASPAEISLCHVFMQCPSDVDRSADHLDGILLATSHGVVSVAGVAHPPTTHRFTPHPSGAVQLSFGAYLAGPQDTSLTITLNSTDIHASCTVSLRSPTQGALPVQGVTTVVAMLGLAAGGGRLASHRAVAVSVVHCALFDGQACGMHIPIPLPFSWEVTCMLGGLLVITAWSLVRPVFLSAAFSRPFVPELCASAISSVMLWTPPLMYCALRLLLHLPHGAAAVFPSLVILAGLGVPTAWAWRSFQPLPVRIEAEESRLAGVGEWVGCEEWYTRFRPILDPFRVHWFPSVDITATICIVWAVAPDGAGTRGFASFVSIAMVCTHLICKPCRRVWEDILLVLHHAVLAAALGMASFTPSGNPQIEALLFTLALLSLIHLLADTAVLATFSNSRREHLQRRAALVAAPTSRSSTPPPSDVSDEVSPEMFSLSPPNLGLNRQSRSTLRPLALPDDPEQRNSLSRTATEITVVTRTTSSSEVADRRSRGGLPSLNTHPLQHGGLVPFCTPPPNVLRRSTLEPLLRPLHSPPRSPCNASPSGTTPLHRHPASLPLLSCSIDQDSALL